MDIHTQVQLFERNRVQIKTTVTDIWNKKVIDDCISSFLRTANDNWTKVIGFDIQCSLSKNTELYGGYCKSKIATLNFCDGYSCLIIRLRSFHSYRYESDSEGSCKSLLNFLSLPCYTFVGIGIRDNLEKLEMEYGMIGNINRINAVELRPLAVSVMEMPHLNFCGVDELAFVVSKVDLRKHRPLNVVFDWGVLIPSVKNKLNLLLLLFTHIIGLAAHCLEAIHQLHTSLAFDG